MKILLTALLACLWLTGHTQKVLEVKETKSHVKVITDDSSLYMEAEAFFKDSLQYVNIQYKKDRAGTFKRFTLYLPLSMKDEVTAFENHIKTRK